jgi:hypothetical protein
VDMVRIVNMMFLATAVCGAAGEKECLRTGYPASYSNIQIASACVFVPLPSVNVASRYVACDGQS